MAVMGLGCENNNITVVLPARDEPGAGSSAVEEPEGDAPGPDGTQPTLDGPPGSSDGELANDGATPDDGIVTPGPSVDEGEPAPEDAPLLPPPPARRAWLAFPDVPSIVAPGWTTIEAFPDLGFDNPVGLYEAPGTGYFFVNERDGKLFAFRRDAPTAKQLVLDLSAVTQGAGDSGLLGLAFHPEFGRPESPNRGYVYLHYAYSEAPVVGQYPEWNQPTRSRLARFTVDLAGLSIDPASELVLIDQDDDSVWHQGGALLFRPSDGFLYISVGDEGGGICQLDNCQRLDKDLFSGVLRIDVDQRGGDISHPIQRQPQSGVTANYYIPNDNPFVGQPGVLEEFYAIGLRSPHRMTVDPVDDLIWIGDVGQGAQDEVDVLAPGANYQWPALEGIAPGFVPAPAAPIGVWTDPVVTLSRSEARSIIGGFVYRGSEHPELWGKYIFGDFATGNMWALAYDDSTGTLTVGERELLFQSELRDYGQNGLTSFAVDAEGELYLLFLGSDSKIRRLARTPGGANVPSTLSETGAFVDTPALAPSPSLFPYDVASPLYSDGAEKQRWLVLPPERAASFTEAGPLGFPEGSVFVKHFELALDEREPSRRTRLETRFLVVGAAGQPYGVTYRWNEAGTDAELVLASQQVRLQLVGQDGSVRERQYYFPGPGDCQQCHNSGAGGLLGLRAAQLNRDVIYPGGGGAVHQLLVWSELGLLDRPLLPEEVERLPRLSAIDDDSRPVEDRIRSYWDSNCAMCHGVTEIRAAWDARYSTPLASQGILLRPPFSGPSPSGDVLLNPGDPASSIIYQRSMSDDPSLRMPPIGRTAADEAYVELLERWIVLLAGSAPAP